MTGYAQEISYGVKGGINLSSIGGDFTDGNKQIFGFHGGFVAEIPLLENFSIQPEIVYSMQGGKRDTRATDGPLTETTLEYISIPVLAKYYLIDNLSLKAGPQVGFLLSAEREITPSGFGGTTEKRTEDIKDNLNTLDIAAAIGAEYKFDIGIFLQLRYALGVSNINKDSITMRKNQNNVFQLAVGYTF